MVVSKSTLWTDTRGSALLISLLLMVFLMIFGFGISRLVIDAIRVERNVVEAGKAYFAAESGIEEALYYRDKRIPGYQAQDDDGVAHEFTLENDAETTYAMVAYENEIPCEHRGEETRTLAVQDSISWPLYRWSSDGAVTVTDFSLIYDLDRSEAGEDQRVNGEVLRWKILGLDDDGGYTEAISGLLSFSQNSADNVLTGSDTASFYEKTGSTYVYNSAAQISTFLEEHRFNTLILTNVIALSGQEVGLTGASDNNLEIKMSTESQAGEEGTACEYTLIEADGMSSDIKQSIDVQVRLDSFLPVFDFALYQTDGE